MKVDIIIPIYNAYDYLVACVKSIIKYTEKEDYNLILVNDCSLDNRIQDYLKELDSIYNNIFVYENEKNLGFVGTVNRGMKLSENDVILLNSDTEVTPNWLQKMKKAAKSSHSVATVTALTNSGTICSVPNFCEDNTIPSNLTSFLDLAEIVEKSGVGLYVEAPTGIGFCMYINRNIINEIGYFDEERFGKGYGEENDFCCRAREHGYKNIIDDTTFIYHKGSASFCESKNDYISTNLKVLHELYPYYFRHVEEFIKHNPLETIHKLIKLNILLKNDHNNIMFILHNDFIIGRNHPCGGTERHVCDLVEKLKYDNNCFVFTTFGDVCYVDIFVEEKLFTLKFKILSSIKIVDYYRDDYRKIFETILKYFNISMIHIHHMKGHTFDIFDVAKELRIPVLYTLHDYYCVCPNINLLYNDSEYCCNIRGNKICNECIKKKTGYNQIGEKWRKLFYYNLVFCDKIIVPSIAAKDELIKIFKTFKYDYDKLNFTVIEHGEFSFHEKFNVSKLNNKFTVCIFGGIIKHKGSEHLYNILSDNILDIEWHIYGQIYDDRIKQLNKVNVHIHSTYEQKEIISILRKCNPDLILNLPIWPETFSYVLTESFLAGIPVIGSNIGALSQRITEGENGWKVDLLDMDRNVINKLTELMKDRNQIYLIKEKMSKQKYKTIDEMIDEYREIYKNYHITKFTVLNDEEKKVIYNGLYEDEEKMTSNLQIDEAEYKRLLIHVQEINESKIWKIFVNVTSLISWLKKIKNKFFSFFIR